MFCRTMGRAMFALGFTALVTVAATAATDDSTSAQSEAASPAVVAQASPAPAAPSSAAPAAPAAGAPASGSPAMPASPAAPPPAAAPATAAPLVPAGETPPPPDFGNPPSGEIPILYNDHHVYAKPDELKEGRVLAGIAKNKTLLIPLTAMVQQMGGFVIYDSATQTFDIQKNGADAKVTVGKNEVIINGEMRPLDVPPQMYRGVVVVPVRILSEALGAYVEWSPGKRVVVIRYIPPPPPPTPSPTPVPTAPPPAAIVTPPPPTPEPTLQPLHVVTVNYLVAPRVYNEFVTGVTGVNSFSGDLDLEENIGMPVDIYVRAQRLWYLHTQSTPTNYFGPGTTPSCSVLVGDPGCVTVIGKYGQTFVPQFQAHETDYEVQAGLYRLRKSRIYFGLGVFTHSTNYGYPNITGAGIGIHKTPDVNEKGSLYFNFYYYPMVGGNYTVPFQASNPYSGNTELLQYSVFRYSYGATFQIKKTPAFVQFGSAGEKWKARTNAPVSVNRGGTTVGLGFHF